MLKAKAMGERNQTSLSIRVETRKKLDFLVMHEKPRPLKMEELHFLIEERIKELGLTNKWNKGHINKQTTATESTKVEAP